MVNFLLLVEDNFSEQHERGRKTDTNRKIIVTAGGPLREAFKNNTLKYDPENMMFLKKRKCLEQDYTFFDKYISDRMKQITTPAPVTSSPASISNMAGSSSTSLSPIVLDMFSRLSKRKKVKDARKQKRKRESSSSGSNSSSSNSEESADEVVKKSRNRKKKEKKNVVDEMSGMETLESSDKGSSESVGEYDDDPTYGTSQKPNSKPKKKGPSRHPNDRKVRQDILKLPPKKVLTPGSFNLKKRAPAKKVNAKNKTNINHPHPSVHSPSFPDPSIGSDVINSTMTGTRKVTQWMKDNSLLGKSGEKSEPVKNTRQSAILNQDACLSNPTAVRENPVAVTKDPVAVTKNPVAVTKNPVAVTKNPVAVTKDPVAVTKDPVTVTKGPGALKKGLETMSKDLAGVTKNSKKAGKKSNHPIPEKPKQGFPNNASCPSGQFKGVRGAKMLEKVAENASKKLMTDEEIEKFLAQTPTRKR